MDEDLKLDPSVYDTVARGMVDLTNLISSTEITESEAEVLREFRRLAMLVSGLRIAYNAADEHSVLIEMSEGACRLLRRMDSKLCIYLAKHLLRAVSALNGAEVGARWGAARGLGHFFASPSPSAPASLREMSSSSSSMMPLSRSRSEGGGERGGNAQWDAPPAVTNTTTTSSLSSYDRKRIRSSKGSEGSD